MFQFLRRMIGPIMITVLVAFIATIIFSWGGGGFQSQPDDTIGIINGENISYRVFEQYYCNILRQEQAKAEDELTADQMNTIRDRAWKELQADYILNKEIENYGIKLSPDEVYTYLKFYPPQDLQQAPVFMTDGKFDYNKYVGAMANPQYASLWASVEQMVSPGLLKFKLQTEIASTARVTPAEVMQAFLNEKEMIRIDFINVADRDFQKSLPAVNVSEMQQYYDSHKEDYKKGVRAVLDVVAFAKQPSEADWERLKFEADQIYDSAAAGADFAELAQTYSQDNSAERGGDLGWFARGRMVAPFDSAVFSMRENQISRPVRTQFGWHIIKLLGIKMEKETPQGETEAREVEKRNAAHILLKAEPSEDTYNQLSQNATDFMEEARKKGFAEAATEYSYEVKSTQPFDKSGFITFLGRNKDASDFAFTAKVADISEVFEDKGALYVAQLKEIIPEGYTSFEEAKTTIERQVGMEKAKKVAEDTARVVWQAVKAGMRPADAAARYGFVYDTTGLINRNAVVRNVGNDPYVMGGAFALANIGDISEPIRYNNGVMIIRLLEKQSPNLDEFNRGQDSIYSAALSKKQQDMYRRWYEKEVEKAQVETFIDKFYRSM